jgi:hypothetical protein
LFYTGCAISDVSFGHKYLTYFVTERLKGSFDIVRSSVSIKNYGIGNIYVINGKPDRKAKVLHKLKGLIACCRGMILI